MKSLITRLIFFVCAIVSVQAQTIPECIQPCLKGSIAAVGCAEKDLACICGPNANTIQNRTSTCLGVVTSLTDCSANEIAAAAIASRAICAAFFQRSGSTTQTLNSAAATPSRNAASVASSVPTSSPSSSPSIPPTTTAAIGAGVAVGFVLFAGIVFFWLWIRKRRLRSLAVMDVREEVERGDSEKEVFTAPDVEGVKEKKVNAAVTMGELDGKSLKKPLPSRPEVFELA